VVQINDIFWRGERVGGERQRGERKGDGGKEGEERRGGGVLWKEIGGEVGRREVKKR
jgi:hypothetical protein